MDPNYIEITSTSALHVRQLDAIPATYTSEGISLTPPPLQLHQLRLGPVKGAKGEHSLPVGRDKQGKLYSDRRWTLHECVKNFNEFTRRITSLSSPWEGPDYPHELDKQAGCTRLVLRLIGAQQAPSGKTTYNEYGDPEKKKRPARVVKDEQLVALFKSHPLPAEQAQEAFLTLVGGRRLEAAMHLAETYPLVDLTRKCISRFLNQSLREDAREHLAFPPEDWEEKLVRRAVAAAQLDLWTEPKDFTVTLNEEQKRVLKLPQLAWGLMGQSGRGAEWVLDELLARGWRAPSDPQQCSDLREVLDLVGSGALWTRIEQASLENVASGASIPARRM